MTRTIANVERGCGFLSHGKAYIRGVIGSPDGVLPSFVRLDPPVPYREMGTDGQFTRGYLRFDGLSSQFALDDLSDFVREYPGDATDTTAVQNMVDKGLYDSPDATPGSEARRHVDRLDARRFDADHFGEIDLAAHGKRPHADILMRAGKTHYPDPGDFIDEAVTLGISKAIPLSKRQAPPVVEPGITRVWVIHPDTDVGWAVIGYAYLQEVVYTQHEDGTVPEYVQDHAAAGTLDVVDIEPPRSHEDDTGLGRFRDSDDAAADVDATPGGSDPETVVPSDKDGRDVEAAPADADVGVEARTSAWEAWYSDQGSYNDLKSIAAAANQVDLGSTPATQDIIDALAAAGYDPRQGHAEPLLNNDDADPIDA